ncbi:hypothetical protein HW555_012208 [Spodoptera exigua]|uniref:Major facilitator superfamily (MFS) profile domain-containing protein n=1 Tax=Spodoptera exigua TaxID=7107 RepID=A0A835KY53_SPOEX|nr:hypothetical protein HW555_012208 [Spodoptera exigua]
MMQNNAVTIRACGERSPTRLAYRLLNKMASLSKGCGKYKVILVKVLILISVPLSVAVQVRFLCLDVKIKDYAIFKTNLQCFVSATVCFTTIGHGSVVGFPAILLPQVKDPNSHIQLTREEGSWIASVTAITLLLGSFLAPPIMGRLGRKIAHFVVIALILLGWIVILLATSLEAMIVGRVIHGMSFGLMLPLRSALLGEYTSPKNRGAFLTTVSVAQAFGILLVHLIGSLVTWQKTILIVIVFPLASLLMTFFTPESPSWLAARGRFDDCRRVFPGPDADAHLWMIELDTQRNISNIIAVYVVNKIKRRTMFMATGGLCILSNIAIAGYVYAKILGVLTYTAIWVPILLINIQFFTVAVGMVCLPYVIAGEIFPLEYRSVGGSISIVSIASGYFLVTKTFPAMVESIGLHGSYAVYAAAMSYNLCVVWFLLPETKGKTLQQIEDHFKGKTTSPEEEEVRQQLRDKPDCFVTSAVGINLIGHGAVVGFAAVLLPQLHEPHSDIHTSKTADSWIASVVGITLLIGSFLASPIMGRYGRKVAHYTISVSALVGWLTTLLADSVEVILIGRIIGGLSFGLMLPLRSILIGEYTSPKNRGAFLTTISLTQGCGIFFVHLVGSLLSWRRTALVCLFLPFISLVMTLFTPESPSWLVSKGRYNECREVFHWLRGDEEDAELEAMIEARMNFEKTMRNQKKLDIIATVQKQEFYKPIILMVHVYAMGQLSGGAIIAAYATTIIELVMNPGVNSGAWMIGLDSQRIIVNTLAIFVINWFKRRTMMFSSGVLCVASHVAIVAYVYLKDQGVLSAEAIWIPGILLNIQFFSVSIGMVPLPSVIAGEVFPLEYRSLAGSISQASVAGTMFLVLKTFPGLVDNVGITGTYLVYAGLLTYCLFVIMFLMPETKGKTLQEIEDGYRGVVVTEEERQSLNSIGDNGKIVSSETKS